MGAGRGMLGHVLFRVWLAATPLMVVLGACGEKDDEVAIRNVIREGARLAEEHDTGALLKLTTLEFRASPGEVNRQEVKRYLLYVFMRYKEFKLLYPQPSVEMQGGDRAAATFPFLIVQKDQTIPDLRDLVKDPDRWLQQLGDKADLYRLKLEFIKTGDDWRVSRAHLEALR